MATPNTVYPPHKSSIGLDANIVMLIAYLGGSLLGFIPIVRYVAFAVPIVLFFVEKASPYVKFHAAQAIVLQLVGAVFSIIFGILSAILSSCAASLDYSSALGILAVIAIVGVISWIISIVLLVFEIICLVKSWKYECYKLPLFGGLAEKLAAKFPIV